MRYLLVTACLALSACGNGISADYADRMPSSDAVGRTYSNDVRKAVACATLEDAIKIMANGRSMSASEQRVSKDYANCRSGSSIVNGQPVFPTLSFTERARAKMDDTEFRRDAMERLFPAQDRPAFARAAAVAEQQKALSRERLGVEVLGYDPHAEQLQKFRPFVLLFGTFGLVALLRVFLWRRGLRPLPDGTGFSAGGATYTLHELSGVLAAQDRERHTVHTPGTVTTDGYGRVVSQTSGSTSTTLYQTFYVLTADGEERSMKLTDWHIEARPGNRVAVIWAVKRGAADGPIVYVENFTTNLGWTGTDRLQKMLGIGPLAGTMLLFGLPPVIFYGLTAAGAGDDGDSMRVSAIVGVVAAIALLIVTLTMRNNRIRRFKEDVLPPFARRAAEKARLAEERLSRPPITPA